MRLPRRFLSMNLFVIMDSDDKVMKQPIQDMCNMCGALRFIYNMIKFKSRTAYPDMISECIYIIKDLGKPMRVVSLYFDMFQHCQPV